jgi:hypothetical protein
MASNFVQNKKIVPFKNDYSVDVESEVPPALRANNPSTAIPEPPVNGGLFSGPPATGPWGAIPVYPTTTNMIHNNLRSANPPPGAVFHYPGGQNRMGNNYIPQPGVYWLNDSTIDADGKYNIKMTDYNHEAVKKS